MYRVEVEDRCRPRLQQSTCQLGIARDQGELIA